MVTKPGIKKFINELFSKCETTRLQTRLVQYINLFR